jgi:hypothetical protein
MANTDRKTSCNPEESKIIPTTSLSMEILFPSSDTFIVQVFINNMVLIFLYVPSKYFIRISLNIRRIKNITLLYF